MFDDWWYYCEENLTENLWYCTDDLGQSVDWRDTSGNNFTMDVGNQAKVLSYFGNPNSDNFAGELTWKIDQSWETSSGDYAEYFNKEIFGHTIRQNIGMVDIMSHQYGHHNNVLIDSITFYHPVSKGGLFFHGAVENQLDLIGEDACKYITNCITAFGSTDYHFDQQILGHQSSSGTVVPGNVCNSEEWSEDYFGISEDDYVEYANSLKSGTRIYVQGNWYFIDGVESTQVDDCNYPAKLVHIVRNESELGNFNEISPINNLTSNQVLYNSVEVGAKWHIKSTQTYKVENLTDFFDEYQAQLSIDIDEFKDFNDRTLPFIWDQIESLLEKPTEIIYNIHINDFQQSQFGITFEQNNHGQNSASYNYVQSRNVVLKDAPVAAEGFTLLYELDIANGVFGDGSISYDLDFSDHLSSISEVEKVAYHLELVPKDAPLNYDPEFIFTSFTPHSESYTKFSDYGVPSTEIWTNLTEPIMKKMILEKLIIIL